MNSQDIVFGLHITVLVYLAWTVFQADHLGFDWIRGKEAVLSAEELRKLHKRTWIGLTLMIATGVILFWPEREFLLTRDEFYVKMGFVLALIINGFVVGNLQKVATEKPFRALSKKERLPLMISGTISTISWAGAAIMAFFLLPG